MVWLCLAPCVWVVCARVLLCDVYTVHTTYDSLAHKYLACEYFSMNKTCVFSFFSVWLSSRVCVLRATLWSSRIEVKQINYGKIDLHLRPLFKSSHCSTSTLRGAEERYCTIHVWSSLPAMRFFLSFAWLFAIKSTRVLANLIIAVTIKVSIKFISENRSRIDTPSSLRFVNQLNDIHFFFLVYRLPRRFQIHRDLSGEAAQLMLEYKKIHSTINNDFHTNIPECWAAFVPLKSEYYKGTFEHAHTLFWSYFRSNWNMYWFVVVFFSFGSLSCGDQYKFEWCRFHWGPDKGKVQQCQAHDRAVRFGQWRECQSMCIEEGTHPGVTGMPWRSTTIATNVPRFEGKCIHLWALSQQMELNSNRDSLFLSVRTKFR